ncbi:hypothetical protein I552_8046 [Mycobacterium xenopi 3993]|nr:hypothetical protein I552_8046 [Mycobacterium xenopi 3993]
MGSDNVGPLIPRLLSRRPHTRPVVVAVPILRVSPSSGVRSGV